MIAEPAAEATIFALSSGTPPAAIAVVRISGPNAAAAVTALAGRLPPPRRAKLQRLRDAADETLDRALVLWFPGPDTATGEDLAELHLHGGRAVIAAVLAALGGMTGLEPAAPGAFTRRAFANGRIDLGEAEGLADLLEAETEGQRRQALRLAEGGLGRLVEGWRRQGLALAAAVEAAIDHEDESDVPPPDILPGAARLEREIADALAAPPAERLRDGVRVVLAGPVNAGKSSLINALAGRDVAIVSDIAGTTRDLVEAPVMIDGVPLILIDSAGLRSTDDAVEQIGTARAQAAIDGADIVLWLGPPGRAPNRSGVIFVAAKADLGGAADGPAIPVSSQTFVGIAALQHEIVSYAHALLPTENRLALNNRHRLILHAIIGDLAALRAQANMLLQAEHLRSVLYHLDKLTGRAGFEDMLDTLFARFCVGK